MRLTKRTLRLAILASTLALIGACSSGGPGGTEAPETASPTGGYGAEDAGYAGSASCRECHEVFYERWAPSHHGLAMQPYSDQFAQANLSPQSGDLELGSRRYHAEVAPGQGWVLESRAGRTEELRIDYVLGGKNVYYFLTPLSKGRLQTLPIAYDVHRRVWFDTAASGVRHFPGEREGTDAPVDWTDWRYTFNTACHGCHVSQLATNYDAASDSYRTVWREPGIACETCHGPAAQHVRIARATPEGQPLPELAVVQVRTLSPELRNDLCASCHAKLMPLTNGFKPGERFFDHFDLATLEDPDFYPDGRDLGENYTFTSWLMSPCAQSGELDCVHCHTSSGRYRFQSENFNDACMPCHANKVRDITAHTHHPPESEGSRCISCHMPMSSFAQMNRSDHSMRPPSPAATMAFQSPNACNSCHSDQTAGWADSFVRQWRSRDYQAPILRLGRLVEAARKQDWKRLPEILEYIQSPDRQEVFAASLLRLTGSCPNPAVIPAFLRAAEDPSPLVRSAAVEALSLHPSPESVRALLDAAGDERRVVRIRAAAGLLELPRQQLGPADAARLAQATEEYLAFITARPDQWSSHYNVGNYYLAQGSLRQSISAFTKASQMEPRAPMPLVNASIAHARLGEMASAEDLLERALRLVPENAAANFNMGLLQAEKGDFGDAETRLRAALKTDPQMAEAAYNLGLLVSRRDVDEGIRWCARAFELSATPKYGYTLAYLLREKGDLQQAVTTLEGLLKTWPGDPDSCLLLADIYFGAGRAAELEQLNERAHSQGRLQPDVLSRLAAMVKALHRKGPSD